MTSFKTFRELLNYIPNCIICGKELPLSLEGYPVVLHTNLSKPTWPFKYKEYVKLKLEKKDILISTNKKHNVSINPDNNEIIEGKELVNRMLYNQVYVTKNCTTCDFKIFTEYKSNLGSKADYAQWEKFKKFDAFPELLLRTESMRYTFTKGKPIEIRKWYSLNVDDKSTTESLSIVFNNKTLDSVPFDFSKFTSRAQLNKRLLTIVTFQ